MRFAALPNTSCWLRRSGDAVKDVERQLCPVACLSTFIHATGLTNQYQKERLFMTTTVNDRVRKVKPVLGFGGVSDVDLLKRLDAIRDGMTGNAAFANPPVDMATFKTAIDLFNTLATEALDGGKKVISPKRK